MLAGFRGHLISESFLEQHLEARATSEVPSADGVHRTLVEWRKRTASFGPASGVRTLAESGAGPLLSALGFEHVHDVEIGRDALTATIVGAESPVALIVTEWGQRLDPQWRLAVLHAGRIAASWALLFNGTSLRLIDARRLYSRRYLEFDIDAALDDPRTFGALMALLRAAMFASPIEASSRSRSPLQDLVDASEQHASAVCYALRHGVLGASGAVLDALTAPARGNAAVVERAGIAAFEQALTIVYRLLFLLFAEARGLLPLWHPLYRDSYSVHALRDAAAEGRNARGLWDALRASSRLAHAGCQAGDLRIAAFNGRLFAPAGTPLAERRDLDDDAARRAVVALSMRTAPDGRGLERISYRDLGVEQLGAVYEALLDYAPRARPIASRPGGTRWRAVLELGAGTRKATGSFYTPQPIAHYLVRRTLAPLLENATSAQILALTVLDPAMGSGAFLVAACRQMASAYEAALVREGACHPSDFGPSERASIRRTIAERCLYGVDLNPMAVQLARLSLWLATLSAGRPLSFLDHRLQVGNSLVGAWLVQLRHPPVRSRASQGTLPLIDQSALDEALRQALPVRFSLAAGPDDTVEQVHEKERALAALTARHALLSKWKRIADLWCAPWFSSGAAPPNAFRDLSDFVLTGRSGLTAATARDCLDRAAAAAAAHRFFHWELEFPEVFFDRQGAPLPSPGFDAIVGNPPWEMMRADAGSSEERARTRDDIAATVRFTRDSGTYAGQSSGHANSYQLFVERAVSLIKRGGRIGLILPSGLATDYGSAPIRRLLFSRCAVDTIVGFENSQRVFPIHRSTRFLVMTASGGGPTTEVACRLGEKDPAVLETEGGANWFPVRLTPALIKRLSGDDLSIPDLRSEKDLAIAERAAALFHPLGDDRGWSVRFGRELNVTEDREAFGASRSGLPVVEGKQVAPFQADISAVRWHIAPADAERLLGRRHRHPRLAYRDVAGATNRLTLIAAMLPAGCVSTHTLFCLRTALPLKKQMLLCGLFNSLVVNYLVRLRVSTHVTTGIVERLPLPRWDDSPTASAEIADLARWLAERPDAGALARLNALVAHLFQLSHQDFAHVLGTFPLIPAAERDAALRDFAGGYGADRP